MSLHPQDFHTYCFFCQESTSSPHLVNYFWSINSQFSFDLLREPWLMSPASPRVCLCGTTFFSFETVAIIIILYLLVRISTERINNWINKLTALSCCSHIFYMNILFTKSTVKRSEAILPEKEKILGRQYDSCLQMFGELSCWRKITHILHSSREQIKDKQGESSGRRISLQCKEVKYLTIRPVLIWSGLPKRWTSKGQRNTCWV